MIKEQLTGKIKNLTSKDQVKDFKVLRKNLLQDTQITETILNYLIRKKTKKPISFLIVLMRAKTGRKRPINQKRKRLRKNRPASL